MDFKPACGSGEGEGESERFENSIRQTHSTIALPLTLTLSPGERERLSDGLLYFKAFFALLRAAYLRETSGLSTASKALISESKSPSPSGRGGVRGRGRPSALKTRYGKLIRPSRFPSP